MLTYATAALLAAVSMAEDPTGFAATGAEISVAKGTFYQGWNDLTPKLVDKVHNSFAFTNGSTWASGAGETAEVWSCYKEGSSTYNCVISALSNPNTGIDSYTLT